MEELKIKVLFLLKLFKVFLVLKVEEVIYKVESEGKVNKSNIIVREFFVVEF